MNSKEDIGFLIHRIDKGIKENMDSEMSRHDLTFSQSQVLRRIQMHDGELSQKQLQDLLNVSHPTIVGLVRRLETKGYVECALDPDDRRNKIVRTTELADNYKKDMVRARERFDRKLYRELSQEELQELSELLEKMYANIE